jgi:hypothetical protein
MQDQTLKVQTFPANASWADMSNHLIQEHTSGARILASMNPDELEKEQRRLGSGIGLGEMGKKGYSLR